MTPHWFFIRSAPLLPQFVSAIDMWFREMDRGWSQAIEVKVMFGHFGGWQDRRRTANSCKMKDKENYNKNATPTMAGKEVVS